jgi:hypothetical protein
MRDIAGNYVPEPLTCAYFKTDKAFFVAEYIDNAINLRRANTFFAPTASS